MLALGVLLTSGATEQTTLLPSSQPGELTLAAPIERWDEALPLGNGLIGALLWGDGARLNLSLDRGDLWDLRRPDIFNQPNWNYATMQRLKADGNQAEMNRLFDEPYERLAYPTKLPAGRVEISLPTRFSAETFTLDLARAEGRVRFTNGTMLTALVAAESPVVLVVVPSVQASVVISAPTAVSALGYDAATPIDEEGFTGYIQQGVLGLQYGVLARSERRGTDTVLAMTVFSSTDGRAPLPSAKATLRAALASGYQRAVEDHTKWWRQFWSTSSVTIPDDRLQRHYNLVKYFYGAASRSNTPPMPLQGVWTADNGTLPPWKGDYHNDLNTQASYIAYQTAGLFDEGEGFLSFMSDLLPTFRTFATSFYSVGGAVVPGVMTLTGEATAGWGQYALSPTNGAWVSHLFARHWRYTQDTNFLEAKAYPFCLAVATALEELLRPGADGLLRLPLSTSPEIFDNSMRAWLPPMSNYDLALVRSAFTDMVELEQARNQPAAARRWTSLLTKLPKDIIDPSTNSLMFARGLAFDQSHRHFSHSMAVHPLGQYDVSRDDDARVINGTIDTIARAGTSQWVGYSFSWFATMLARAGRADEALHYLTQYERSFTLRNGFHANGEQTREGLSTYHYRPFTLEGNFLAMEAVHEMLLQSHGGVLRIFPAVSDSWPDVRFDRLRAEGGFIVSAERRAGQTVSYRIEATVDGLLRMPHPFGDQDVVRAMKKGELIVGRHEATAARPPSDWR